MNKKIVSIIGAVAVALCAVVGGVIFIGMQTSATGTQIEVSVESPTVEKDEEIKVLVTVSSGESMNYIKADLNYNPEVLELVSTSTDLASGANGEIYIIETLAYGESERTYELTFKALSVGTTEISLHDACVELYESLEMMNVSDSAVSVEVVENTSVSDDARIKDIMIAGILDMDERFDPDVYEYNLEVGMSMEMFMYSATPMEKNSIVTAPEDLTLNIGENHFEVRITAPAGNEQIYVFNITRLDHELESETELETETETSNETETETSAETSAESTAEEIEAESETSGTELLAVPETEVVK